MVDYTARQGGHLGGARGGLGGRGGKLAVRVGRQYGLIVYHTSAGGCMAAGCVWNSLDRFLNNCCPAAGLLQLAKCTMAPATSSSLWARKRQALTLGCCRGFCTPACAANLLPCLVPLYHPWHMPAPPVAASCASAHELGLVSGTHSSSLRSGCCDLTQSLCSEAGAQLKSTTGACRGLTADTLLLPPAGHSWVGAGHPG